MHHPFIAALAALAIAVTASPHAAAQKAPDPLESRLVARKVVTVEGRESLVDAASARPGDVIEYVATYRNGGKATIRGLQATLPIPPQTEYLPGSARPARAQASTDGRTFADMPLKRTVTRNGAQVEELVPYREYRALRWNAGELGGENSLAFTARVRVSEGQP
jgi:uncharacterized repeat protein (TIGR01451 family)